MTASLQVEIKSPVNLHNDSGQLATPGWSRHLLQKYDRSKITAAKFRIKEWDYYCLLNDNYGLALTIADNAYMGFISATFFDFTQPAEYSNSIMTLFPMGKFNMPADSASGHVLFQNKKAYVQFIREKEYRILDFNFKKFHNNKALHGRITLNHPIDYESTVIATPFPQNPKAFYYNQKVNCMPGEGTVHFGETQIHFDADHSYAVLDWGRGVWTYNNTWYWGSGSGKIGNDLFGFNIGYGFGDTSRATENTLFYNGLIHKLERITFHIPEDDFMKPWKFTSSDQRFEMDFQPILDRSSKTNILIIQSDQHQVFGKFSGKAVLDNGQEIILKDFLGFAEKVKNRW